MYKEVTIHGDESMIMQGMNERVFSITMKNCVRKNLTTLQLGVQSNYYANYFMIGSKKYEIYI